MEVWLGKTAVIWWSEWKCNEMTPYAFDDLNFSNWWCYILFVVVVETDNNSRLTSYPHIPGQQPSQIRKVRWQMEQLQRAEKSAGDEDTNFRFIPTSRCSATTRMTAKQSCFWWHANCLIIKPSKLKWYDLIQMETTKKSWHRADISKRNKWLPFLLFA